MQLCRFLARSLAPLVLLCSLSLPGSAVSQQGSSCTPGWVPAALTQGANNWIRVLKTLDDGSGPKLYAGGWFTSIGNTNANRVACWNGSQWEALGSGMPDNSLEVSSLTLYDEGQGPRLFAAGQFSSAGGVAASNIARWDGTSWSALGSGTSGNTRVRALAVFDSGSGPFLFAGGEFTTAGGISAPGIARWNGSTWSSVGSTVTNGWVHSLAVVDLGSGPRLYAGGNFTTIGGVSANRIARWDGTSWSALGTGVSGPNLTSSVSAITVHDFGTGPQLCIGGSFSSAGGITAQNVARWNGTNWSAFTPTFPVSDPVTTLASIDVGSGKRLFAGSKSLGLAPNLRLWNGASWVTVGGNIDGEVNSLAEYDDGSGLKAYVGGTFLSTGGQSAACLACWNGSAWTSFGAGVARPVIGATFVESGATRELYVLADTFGWGTENYQHARWNGSRWQELPGATDVFAGMGSGTVGNVRRALVATQQYFFMTYTTVLKYATTTNWITVGTFEKNGGADAATLHDMLDFDVAGIPSLVVAGDFNGAQNHIAVMTGPSTWGTLGTGTSGPVHALTRWDSGAGPQLVAGGSFLTAGGSAARNVALWTGSAWTNLGAGLEGNVDDLVVFDDGSGAAPHAGGSFLTSNGQPVNHIARWNGTDWVPLGTGLNGPVTRLAVFDDGVRPALFAIGSFTSAGGSPAAGIARWDGANWSAITPGMPDIDTLVTADLGSGEELYFGGSFSTGVFPRVAPNGGAGLATWGCAPQTTSTTYCPTPGSPSGCIAQLTALGQASASATTGFLLMTSSVDGQRNGRILYGLGGPQSAPWPGGFGALCVRGPHQRLPVQNSGGLVGQCDGAWSEDWNTFRANNPTALGQPFLGGERLWAQAWYREPLAPTSGILTSALAFDVGP